MPIRDESLHALTALAGVVLGQTDLRSTHVEICRIAVQAIEVAEAASITCLENGRPLATAASDDWGRSLDEMQYAEAEGPCLDATRTGNAFRVRDLAEDPRWPSYAPRAAAVGARSMMSMPLTAEGNLIGALNVYSRTADAFDAEDVSVATIVAGHVGLATEVASAFFQQRAVADGLRQAMASRATIEQAKGILIAEQHLTPDEAFAELVRMSQEHNVKLRDVASALVYQRARPDEGPKSAEGVVE